MGMVQVGPSSFVWRDEEPQLRPSELIHKLEQAGILDMPGSFGCGMGSRLEHEVGADELRNALVDVTRERDELQDELIDERAEHEVTRGMMLALEAKVARLEGDAADLMVSRLFAQREQKRQKLKRRWWRFWR